MNSTPAPDPAFVQRFAADLDALVDPAGQVGIAVSGGPDSLALLLLAAAARPNLVEAATVDHGLRPESRSEAEMVAAICERLSIHHAILTVDSEPPGSNLQAWAREIRYDLLGQWAGERGIEAVATGHHLDDQAETLLMRMARGSGVGGLAAIQRRRPLGARQGREILLVRPLLDWRRAELARIVEKAGIESVEDPSNADERFDRSRARALLEEVEWLDPDRLAAVAGHCSDAEQALDWASRREFERRQTREEAGISLDPGDLPSELKRRLLLRAIELMTGQTPPGPKLAAAMETLEAGGATTLAGLKLESGATWRLSPAPPRRG